MADRTAWIERGRRRRRGSPGNQFPRRRSTVGHRSWPNSAFSGLIRLGSGSGMISVPCVIDLGHQVGTGTLWAGTSTVGRNFTAVHRRSAASGGSGRRQGLRELAQREQGIKACSPKPGSEQRRRAGASTSELGGGDGVVSRTGLTRACSGLLGSKGSFVEFLR